MSSTYAFTLDQQKKLVNLMELTIDEMMPYFRTVIRSTNHAARLPDRDFWTRLFICPNPLMQKDIKAGICADIVPADPYDHIDIQLCMKYLIYGDRRTITLPNGRTEKAKDSLNFFRFFNMDWNEQKSYKNQLHKGISLRNHRKHVTFETWNAMTPRQLVEDMETIDSIMEPFCRRKGWEGDLLSPRSFRDGLMRRAYELLGGLPVEFNRLMETITSGSKTAIRKHSGEVRELLTMAGFPLYDGIVIIDCDPQTLEQGLMAFLQERRAPTAEDAEKLKAFLNPHPEEAPPTPAAEFESLSLNLMRTLLGCGRQLPFRDDVMTAAAEAFQILADESMFLSVDGRHMLHQLIPILKKLERPLLLDASVITSIFRSYRGSAPLPPEILAQSEDPEELEKQRASMHENCRMAIKALRLLQENQCIQIVASPTASNRSYENIRYVAEHYPGHRFLVLSMQRQLAEELSAGHNAAVAKVNLDGSVLLFGQTYPQWKQMLTPGDLPAPPTAEPPASDSKTEILCDTPADRFRVVYDSQGKPIRLLKQLGEGGEGIVFRTELDNAAKIYHVRQRTPERRHKLELMVRENPRIPQLCWPTDLLYADNGAWIGYLMPAAAGKPLEDVVFHAGLDFKNIRDMGWSRRHLVEVGANIAAVFAQMHSHNILVGDVNPRNVMVDQQCNVRLVDCDSYQFAGFSCPVGKPDYTPPEVHKRMRAEGNTEYNYTRTVDNECYSLAVLLFSVLMLGKPPYAARNAGYDDVIDAVIAGHFPYRFNNGEEDSRPTGKIMPPVGIWRNIWSHSTHHIKHCFYNTFTGKGRLSAMEWEMELREYSRLIDQGHSTDEIAPHDFKDTSRNGEESTMIYKTCTMCGKKYNIDREIYEQRKSRGLPDLCSVDYDRRSNRRLFSQTIICESCKKERQIPVSDWVERIEKGQPLLCDSCSNVEVLCADCGTLLRRDRNQIRNLRSNGRQILCRTCLERRMNRR